MFGKWAEILHLVPERRACRVLIHGDNGQAPLAIDRRIAGSPGYVIREYERVLGPFLARVDYLLITFLDEEPEEEDVCTGAG